ncbi:MAG: response regulator [Patescibacteria group bacterium]
MKTEEQSKMGTLPVARVVQNRGTQILIVEDDAFLRNLITRRLLREGFIVEEAANAKAGLDAARKNMPHLILLDILLPDMNGFEMLEEMRKDGAISAIPVIILSNLGQNEELERARVLGAKDFLVKSKYTPAEIIARIKDVLNKSYM